MKIAGLLLSACLPLSVSASTVYVSGDGGIGVYDGTTGAPVNSNFIAFAGFPSSMALSDNVLFVANSDSGSVETYDATTGALLTRNFITTLSGFNVLTVSDNTLFVSNEGTVGTYNAITGAAINANLITGLTGITGIAVSNDMIFVSSTAGRAIVGAYNRTTGAAIDANFISIDGNCSDSLALAGNTLFVGLGGGCIVGYVRGYDATTGAATSLFFSRNLVTPLGLAVLGNTLYLSSLGNNSVNTYNTMTGAALGAPLITGLTGTSVHTLAVSASVIPVPEPLTSTTVISGLALLAISFRNKRSRRLSGPRCSEDLTRH